MIDFIIIAVIAAILGGSAWYIRKEKKRGVKCVGCPNGGTCGGSCSGCSGSGENGCGCGSERA